MSDLFNKVYDYEWMTHQTPETNRNLPEPHKQPEPHKKSEHSQSPSKRHQNSHMREH